MTIKTVETENEGLKRAFMLTIPAQDIEARVELEVKRLAPQIRMPGFRPGKVPPNLIRKMHGESIRGEALQGAVQDGVQQLLSDNKIRPALQPQVELDEGYEPGKDAEIRVSLEALPDVGKPEIEGIELDRLTAEPDDAGVTSQIGELASQNKTWADAPAKYAAKTGDLVVMDFIGKVDGRAFEGGTGEDMSLELGSGRLIPGFEEQLVGTKAGDQRDVKVTFPDDYQVENLKAKDATFAVTVKGVKTAGETKVDEAFAKSLGLNDLDQLKKLIRDQQAQELNGLTRTHMKRQLLDQLAARHDFPVPQSMVEAEYENILGQLRHEAAHEDDPKAALAEIESDAADYRDIAVRRVRLGLLLSEIGAANGVDVTEQEMSRLVMQAASQYQGKDRENFVRYIQQEPMAAAQLRAPLYEDKVVDFLFARAKVTDRKATKAQIEADLESEEGHVHGPDCGHDHAAKPKKGAGKAAATGKSAAASAKVEGAPGKLVAASAKVEGAPGKLVAASATAKGAPAKDALVKAAPIKGPVESKSSAKPVPAKPIKDGAGAKPAEAKAPSKAPAAAKPPAPAKATPVAAKSSAKKPAKKG